MLEPPDIDTVILPSPLLVTVAPLNVIPVTEDTVVIPSPTLRVPPATIPGISTELPSLLFNVSSEVPLLYVPPVTVPVNPVIVIVPPVLLNNSNSVVAE